MTKIRVLLHEEVEEEACCSCGCCCCTIFSHLPTPQVIYLFKTDEEKLGNAGALTHVEENFFEQVFASQETDG